MFGTIRKHQTWLWAVIITLTIISFVIFFSPNSRLNAGRGRNANFGSINGRQITQQDFNEAYREVDLHTFIRTGRWLKEDKGRSEMDVQREVYQWLLLLERQEQLGIHVSDEATAQVARQIISQFQRIGAGTPNAFAQMILRREGLQMEDFERFVRHFVGIQELMSTAGLSGRLVTPQEAKSLYEREHQEIAADAVLFSSTNFLSSVSVAPDAIVQFYSNRVANYLIPDRVQVSYVRFNVTNALGQAETELASNLTMEVEASLQQMGTNYQQIAKTPEEAKTKIREELIRRQAMLETQKKALGFAATLLDLRPVQAENLDILAKSNNLPVAVTEPFDREDGPKDLPVGAEFVKAAFKLTPEEPFGDASPIVGQDGVYIIALKKQIPHETPPLDRIRDKVETDYKRYQAAGLARRAGMMFYQFATNGLAQGKTFTNLCVDAKVTPVPLPPFSISTREFPESARTVEELVPLNQLKQIAFSTTPGKVSNFNPTADGGVVIFVKAKLPVDQARMQADLPGFVSNVRRARQQEAFDEWFRREADKGLRDTPVARPQRPPNMGAGTAKS